MDKKTVFVKTKEGEEAMRQRTRLVQRNLRNILIMVDGHATVADLSRRFGDENVALAALNELQAGGFIAEPASPLDFTSPPPPGEGTEPAEDVPLLTSQIAPPETPTGPAPEIEEIELAAPEYESLPPPALRAIAPKPAPAGPGWMDRIKALFAAKTAKPVAGTRRIEEEDYEETPIRGVDPAPFRPGGWRGFGWPALTLFGVAGIAVLLALTLLLYPYGRHLPDIERNASAMLQDPVKVGDIGFSFLPRPHIALSNITVGRDAYLTIASVRAVPEFLSLLGDRKVFHEVAFKDVAMKDAALGKLTLAFVASPPVQIRHIAIDGLRLAAGDAHLAPVSGEVNMSAAGVAEAVLLHDNDKTMEVELRPNGQSFRLTASGSNWKTPFKPGLTCQSIDVQGELRAGRLELTKLEARAYEGLLAGKASLGWSGGAAFSGDLEIKHMNAAKLLAALGSDLSAEGDLSARLKLSAKADSLGALTEALHADGSFDMKRGAAKGLDLGEAVRTRATTRGGETKFEQLGGAVESDPQNIRLGSIRLSSGLLAAGGSFGIARDGRMSGALNVELKSSAATLRMPLSVGGTAKDPVLTPGRR